MQARVEEQKEARGAGLCVRCVFVCERTYVWDKQTFVIAGGVVLAVGREALRPKGPHKTPQ